VVALVKAVLTEQQVALPVPSDVVALTLANEMIGATGVVARRAADVYGEGDAAGGIEVGGDTGAVSDRRSANERRTREGR
jgi:hypothetical protein